MKWRIGKFRIIRDSLVSKDCELALHEMFGQCVILNAWVDFSRHPSSQVVYQAISPLFDEQNEGLEVPEYDAIFHHDEDGNSYFVKFKRMEGGES